MARRRYQKGSLKLKGKEWLARWREDIIGSDGRVRRVRRTQVIGTLAEFPTERLARRELDRLLARVNSPSYRPGRVATLAEFADRWQAAVLSQRKPSTARAAESHLRCYIRPQLGNLRLDQLDKETVQAFITRLSQNHTQKTVANILATLSAMLNTAKEWGYICEGFSRRGLAFPPCKEERAPRFFTAEQARQIIAAAEEPFATMFAVAAMTGIRPGELCGLTVDDLDFQKRLIYVRRSAWYGKLQAPKSKKSIGVLPMPEPLAARLQSYLATWKPNPERLLFATSRSKPISANNVVQRKLWPILDKLEIPRCGLHAFRHTHASLLVDVGASPTVAQAQLRHSDPRITLGIYTHVLGDAQRVAVERVARILDSSWTLRESQESQSRLIQ